MIRPKTVLAHWAESSVSAIVEVQHACPRMGRIIRTCNVCWRATRAESTVLHVGRYLRLAYYIYFWYYFCIIIREMF